MKRFDWQVILGIILIILSTLFYIIHFFLFRDIHHIFIYLLGDIAFVFIEVLLVTLVLHRLLHHREREALRKKTNMLKGAFFSEVGTDLLRMLAVFEGENSQVSQRLAVPGDWSERAFLKIREEFLYDNLDIDSRKGDLEAVIEFLRGKKPFLLSLLLSNSLLENETFTNLIWSVFHLMEELDKQPRLKDLPEPDRRHIEEDIRRVYHFLLGSWMDFIEHINVNYPFLHSMAVKNNPFDDLNPLKAGE